MRRQLPAAAVPCPLGAWRGAPGGHLARVSRLRKNRYHPLLNEGPGRVCLSPKRSHRALQSSSKSLLACPSDETHYPPASCPPLCSRWVGRVILGCKAWSILLLASQAAKPPSTRFACGDAMRRGRRIARRLTPSVRPLPGPPKPGKGRVPIPPFAWIARCKRLQVQGTRSRVRTPKREAASPQNPGNLQHPCRTQDPRFKSVPGSCSASREPRAQPLSFPQGIRQIPRGGLLFIILPARREAPC